VVYCEPVSRRCVLTTNLLDGGGSISQTAEAAAPPPVFDATAPPVFDALPPPFDAGASFDGH